MSTKAEILQAWRFKEEVVTVNGVTVLLREFSGSVRDAFDESLVKIVNGKREADLTNMRSKLVAACAIDPETGDPMFTADELARAPASFIAPLAKVAQTLNGMDSVEDAEKNSAAAPSGSSSSV